MRFILILGLAIISSFGQAQIEVDKRAQDFGEIVRGTDRVVDFTFTNHGDKPALILRSGFNFEYSILYSSKSIEADSSVTLRVKYNPRSKGKFKEEIPVYFSSMAEPIVLVFQGDVQFIDNSENPACPDFRSRPSDCCGDSDDGFLVEVRDAVTRSIIPKANIRIAKNGRILENLITNKEGQATAVFEPSWYFMDVKADGYARVDSAGYINRRNNHFVFYLDPLRDVVEDMTAIQTLPSTKIPELPRADPGMFGLPEAQPEPITAIEEVPSIAELKENNLVLLVDVSQSMAGQGKLDLLKHSVFELTQILREVDRVSIVTYATKTEILFEGIKGDRAELIMSEIDKLEAGGMTMGSKGFDQAYDVLNSHFIEGGNNELIVVTDGAFRSTDNPKIMGLVRSSAEKGVVTSILGIKGHPGDELKLNEIVLEGKGNYLQIHNLDDAEQILIHEVRHQSMKP